MNIPSPITSGKTYIVKEIKVKNIINQYLENLDIDVSNYFYDLRNIFLVRCLDTGYEFYYPYNIHGNGEFYESLENYDWYYMPWKWEHQKALDIIKKNDKVLEVGSGGLGFLKKMDSLNYKVTGLELNENSVEKARKLKLSLFKQSIQSFSRSNRHLFDVVCSFQVMEHIADIYSFMESQLICLKPGGKLIISVPNNDSFIKISGGGVLNQPPHHMGRWDQVSLGKLGLVFNLKIDSIRFEPLQEYHFDWYIDSIIAPFLYKNRYVRKLYKKVNRRFQKRILKYISAFIKGHSIIVIYRKAP